MLSKMRYQIELAVAVKIDDVITGALLWKWLKETI